MPSNQSQSVTFTREKLEHAHTVVRRLRSRMRALASAAQARSASERAATVAEEAIAVLDVEACVFLRRDVMGSSESFAHARREGIEDEALAHIAARAAATSL